MLLHHLGAPCIANIRKTDPEIETEVQIWNINPEVVIRYEPGGAVLTPAMLYASFIWVDENLATSIKSGQLQRSGVPTTTWNLLIENSILLEDKAPLCHSRITTVQVCGLPTQVLLDVTSACQCDCIACYHKQDLNGHTPTKKELLARIKHLRELGISLFEVTGGEPTLYPELSDILNYIHESGAHYYIVTNGEYLESANKELWQALQNGLGIAVSLDGVGPIHDMVRRRPGLYDKLNRGLDCAKLNGVKPYLISTLHSSNVKDVPQMIELAEKYDTTVHLRPTIQTGAALTNSIGRQSLKELLAQYFGHPHVRNGLLSTKKSIPRARYYGCGIRKRISVDTQGKIYPCVMDRTRHIGRLDLHDQRSLVHALNYETRRFTQNHAICNSCDRSKQPTEDCGGFCRFSKSYQLYFHMKTQPKDGKAYTVIAVYYDRLMTAKKYKTWESIIQRVVEDHAVQRGLAIDLACGTGTITKMLHDIGFKAEGLDLSATMLDQARSKYPETIFHQADMRDFDFPEIHSKIEFVTCFYDSLNYLLTLEDMQKAFMRVSKHLKSGGLFLFDMNTKEHIQASSQNSPRVNEIDDLFTVFRSSEQEGLWQLDMDFFIREDPDQYKRIHECHVERGYNTEDIEPLLEKAGLKLLSVEVEDKIFEDKIKRPSRQYFLAVKP
ncbi:MAG: methyltransferase domain-containing protein [Patescibacteria group bacterium]|nr:methyltransferase domain-containing protein [Patescibacteria group bacterium]